MGRYGLAYVTAALIFCAMDALWLTVMGPRLYMPAIGPLLTAKPALGPAALFYAVYIFAMVYFCVAPGLRSGDWRRAALNGAVLGIAAYGTYDLTNQATLRIWSTVLTVFDLGWGALATAIAAAASVLITTRVLGAQTMMQGRRLR